TLTRAITIKRETSFFQQSMKAGRRLPATTLALTIPVDTTLAGRTLASNTILRERCALRSAIGTARLGKIPGIAPGILTPPHTRSKNSLSVVHRSECLRLSVRGY